MSDLVGGPGNAFYISFIGQRQGQTDQEYWPAAPDDANPYRRNAHLSLFSPPPIFTGPPPLNLDEQAIIGNTFATDDENDWNFVGEDAQLGTGVEFGGAAQRFVVVKVSIGDPMAETLEEQADTVEMWVNPNLSSEEVANSLNAAKVMGLYADDDSGVNLMLGALGMSAGNDSGNRAPGDMLFDEMRVGSSWESVTQHTPGSGGITGDFNVDGAVDAADYTVWRDNLGLGDGALNGNGAGGGTVGQADYDLWRSNYGVGSGPSAASAAPEPGALLMAFAVCVGAVGRRRR